MIGIKNSQHFSMYQIFGQTLYKCSILILTKALSGQLLASPVAHLVKNLPTMQETWVWSLGWKDDLKKGTAIFSSILAWRIPLTEEPGGLQSMCCKESDMTEQLSLFRHIFRALIQSRLHSVLSLMDLRDILWAIKTVKISHWSVLLEETELT